MTKVLLIAQDKGGVGKSLVGRGLAEVVPGAPMIEVDASPRMSELGKRVTFFKTRADREDIESTGGAASRSEFELLWERQNVGWNTDRLSGEDHL